MWRSGSITSQTLYCQEGFDEWSPLSMMLDSLEPTPQPPLLPSELTQVALAPPAKLNPGDIICPNPQCRYIGPPRKVPRGSAVLGLLLFFVFVLPGVIYLIVMSGYNYICPQCGLHIRGGTHA